MIKTILMAGAFALSASIGWAQASDHGGAKMQGDMQAEFTLGDLTISAPFARATLPKAPVGGGFLSITNTGDAPDRLIAASAGIANRTEIHEMAMEDGVMRMRALAEGLEIPAGETIALAPGGYHLMFMDLTGPLIEGETLMVTLTFETAGEIEIPLAIGASNAKQGGHGAMHKDDHGTLMLPFDHDIRKG